MMMNVTDPSTPLTLHAALRARVDQWHLPDRERISDATLDDALRAAIPERLRPPIFPNSPFDIATISNALQLEMDAGDGYPDAPFWIVHDASGRTESDVTWGVAYAIARILSLAETRLLDRDAHRYPRLLSMRSAVDSDVRAWLDECVRLGAIPASALTRYPSLLSLTKRDDFRLLTTYDSALDHDWTAADLTEYVSGFIRRPGYVAALVRVTIEALGSAPWNVAVQAVQSIRTAADGLPWHDAQS